MIQTGKLLLGVLAIVVAAWMFRIDVKLLRNGGGLAIVTDRWTGVVQNCGNASGGFACGQLYPLTHEFIPDRR